MLSRIKVVVSVVAALLLSACSNVELYKGLSEAEANQMVSILAESNVSASKSSPDGKTWAVFTTKDGFAEAFALLQARGLPRERFETLGDVVKKQGLVTTPLEDRARLVYGLSQELSNTLSNFDGVVWARVHISIPEAVPELGGDEKPPVPSAAVFIKYDPDVDLASQTGSIKSLIANSVAGVPYDRVTVVLTPARTFIAPAPKGDVGKPWILGGLGLAGTAVAGLSIFAVRNTRRNARQST